MGGPGLHKSSIREADKPRLIREAEELAQELARKPIRRLSKYSKSVDAKGLTRSHITLFLGFLQSTRDLGQFRKLLGSAEDIDRAKSMNFQNPGAHHTALAEILRDELDRHPKRKIDAWIWLLGWSARLLHTARKLKPEPIPSPKKPKEKEEGFNKPFDVLRNFPTTRDE